MHRRFFGLVASRLRKRKRLPKWRRLQKCKGLRKRKLQLQLEAVSLTAFSNDDGAKMVLLPMTCDLQVLRQPFPVKYRRHLSLLQPQVFDLSTLFVHLSRMMMLLDVAGAPK